MVVVSEVMLVIIDHHLTFGQAPIAIKSLRDQWGRVPVLRLRRRRKIVAL